MLAPAGNSLLTLETPRLLLDLDRLERNCAAMRARCEALGVALRPHLKTAKSVDVAQIATNSSGGITVSTLKEAEHFANAGYRDILYAATIVPGKLAHAARIMETGADLILATDSPDVVAAAARFATERKITLSFLIEIDCGEHRSGLPAGSPEIVALARAIASAPGVRLRGVMTHAGHSYGPSDPAQVVPIAAAERDVAVNAATAIRGAGLPCDIVSVGSTPTVLYADHLRGVTEVRAGIYMLWDLAQLSRKVCAIDDIAVSVLASVIGHNRAGRSLILDAGALALSKDIGANKYLPDAGYGYVCDVRTAAQARQALGRCRASGARHGHGRRRGLVRAPPVGSLVRILPNHACITCAGYEAFDAVRGEAVVGRFPRVNGW